MVHAKKAVQLLKPVTLTICLLSFSYSNICFYVLDENCPNWMVPISICTSEDQNCTKMKVLLDQPETTVNITNVAPDHWVKVRLLHFIHLMEKAIYNSNIWKLEGLQKLCIYKITLSSSTGRLIQVPWDSTGSSTAQPCWKVCYLVSETSHCCPWTAWVCKTTSSPWWDATHQSESVFCKSV